MKKIPVSVLVNSQLPGFVTESGNSMLPKFLEYYYEYLESENEYNNFTREILKYFDSFQTNQDVLDFNFEEVAALPVDIATDKRRLAKHIYDIYRAKGTEEALKTLFRAFYDVEVSITYPSKNILKTSDGKWSRDTEILVRSSFGTLDTLTEARVILTLTSNIDVYKTAYRVSKTPLENDYWLTFKASEQIDVDPGNRIVVRDENNDVTFVGTVQPVPNRVRIDSPGAKFRVGQIFSFKGTFKDSLFKITRVGVDGSIAGVELIQFGLGHPTTQTIALVPYKSIPNSTSVSYSSVPSGLGKHHSLDITDIIYGISDEISAPGISVNSAMVEQISSLPSASANYTVNEYLASVAYITLESNGISQYKGRYLTDDGILSTPNMVLQDSYYYQNYSYVINGDVNLSRYQESVLKLLHPAGMRNFANMVKTVDADATSSYEISRIRKHILRIGDDIEVTDSMYKNVTMRLKEAYQISLYVEEGYWNNGYVEVQYSGPDPLIVSDAITIPT